MSEARISELLNGKRKLNLEIAKKLHLKLNIDAKFLLEIGQNGIYKVSNYGANEPDPKDGTVDEYISESLGKCIVEKYYLTLDNIIFNIDVLDENYLLLRREK